MWWEVVALFNFFFFSKKGGRFSRGRDGPVPADVHAVGARARPWAVSARGRSRRRPLAHGRHRTAVTAETAPIGRPWAVADEAVSAAIGRPSPRRRPDRTAAAVGSGGDGRRVGGRRHIWRRPSSSSSLHSPQ
jgi:hypothetical protein